MSTPPTGEDPRPAPSGPGGAGQPAWGPQAYAQQASGNQAQSGQPAGQQPLGHQPPHPHGQGPAGQQPGYGQWGQQVPPPWGPGGPTQRPPRDRTRTLLITALVAVGLAIAASVALLVYVLSSTVLDRAAVERDVAAQFEEREGVALDLDCRRRMIVRPGADYECEGTTADGEEIEILIIVTDRNGRYSWTED